MYALQTTSYIKPPDENMRARHKEFLRKNLEEGTLKVGGRMADKTGSFQVWEANSLEDAASIASEDPYFIEGFTTFTLKAWNITWNSFTEPVVSPSD